MRFTLVYENDFDIQQPDVDKLLVWLSALRFDLPDDDVSVHISVKDGKK